MIRVTNGEMTLMISKGAYREIYSKGGWIPQESSPLKDPIDLHKGSIPESENIHTHDFSSTENEVIKSMSLMELRQYSSLLGLNVSKLKNREDIIQAIENYEKR